MLLLVISLLIAIVLSLDVPPCVVNISTPNLEASHYNGSWFVIARKAPTSKDYLPLSINSSLIRLIINEEGNLNMTEYHSINGTCMPALSGVWRKEANGYLMEVRTETGHLFQLGVRAIFHEYSGEMNEEMNMVLYGCRQLDSYGKCVPGEELVSIMSNSRHPQTVQLFKSAKHIEDFACIDILQFKTLDTYTSCGDEIVDEDQKLRHAIIYENDAYVDVECRAENFGLHAVDASRFFDEPRMLTVVAYIDPVLEDEQIAHISCLYDAKNHATCEWLRQKSCFKTNLIQEFEGPSSLKIGTKFTTVNGSEANIDWSGMVIWQNGDEYISMKCLLIEEDGSCDQYRVYVWSDEDLMDQPTIREIYKALQEVCVDPTDLIFLNTFHECEDVEQQVAEVPCGPQTSWNLLNASLLEGVWYIAADLNADPKIFLQSAVLHFTPNEKDPSMLNIRYFAQKEFDKECVGPGHGTAKLLDNSTLIVTIEYTYKLVPTYRNTLTFRLQILYIDNQRAVMYWCFRRDKNGTCIQHDVDVLIRSRFFSHNDLSLIQPYLQRACIREENLRWFDLHSQCGFEMSASTKLRRDIVTLSHGEVLDILTNVQEPKCEVRKISGVKANLTAIERGGTWFLMARFDEMALDTYALVARMHTVTNASAVLRMYQSAAVPGEPKMCFERIMNIHEFQNGDDFYYELHFDSANKNSTTLIFRFLFFNHHVGFLYSCLNYKEDGKCEENALYVISRHESIDHAELTVLEKVAKTVCFNPDVLFHTATHDVCVYEHSKLLKAPHCTDYSTPDGFRELKNEVYNSFYLGNMLYAVASSNPTALPMTLKWDGSDFKKAVQKETGIENSVARVRVSLLNRLLFLVDNDTVLFSPSAKINDIKLKQAQLNGKVPCLHPIDYTRFSNATDGITAPVCKSSTPLSAAEGLLGDWYLFASDPYVVGNSKCQVKTSDDDEDVNIFTCYSESWQGECEREEIYSFSVDAWGGYRARSEAPPVHENFELFPAGNISLTRDRMLLWYDDMLVGRRWSVWVRPGFPTDDFNGKPPGLTDYCVYVDGPQTRTMETNC